MRRRAARSLALLPFLLGGCKTTDSGVYERVFFGKELPLANIECIFATLDLDRTFADPNYPRARAAGRPVTMTPQRRDCMLDLGWKLVPPTSARAVRGQVYTVAGAAPETSG